MPVSPFNFLQKLDEEGVLEELTIDASITPGEFSREEAERKARRKEEIARQAEEIAAEREDAEKFLEKNFVSQLFTKRFGRELKEEGIELGKDIAKIPFKVTGSVTDFLQSKATGQEQVGEFELPGFLGKLGPIETYQNQAVNHFIHGFAVEGKNEDEALVDAFLGVMPEIALDSLVVVDLFRISGAVGSKAFLKTAKTAGREIPEASIIRRAISDVAKEVLEKRGGQLPKVVEDALVTLRKPVLQGTRVGEFLKKDLPGTGKLPKLRGKKAAAKTERRTIQDIVKKDGVESVSFADDIAKGKTLKPRPLDSVVAKDFITVTPELESIARARIQNLEALLPAASKGEARGIRSAIKKLENSIESGVAKGDAKELLNITKDVSGEAIAAREGLTAAELRRQALEDVFNRGSKIEVPRLEERILAKIDDRVVGGTVKDVADDGVTIVLDSGTVTTVPLKDIRGLTDDVINQAAGSSIDIFDEVLAEPVFKDLVETAKFNIDFTDKKALAEGQKAYQIIANRIRTGEMTEAQVKNTMRRLGIPEEQFANLSKEELANWFEQTSSLAGRELNYLSQWSKVANQLLSKEELAAIKYKGMTPWQRVGNFFWREVPNFWRSTIITQLATSVRNVSVGLFRFGTKIVSDTMTATLEVLSRKPVTKKEAYATVAEDFFAVSRAFSRMKTKDKQTIIKLLDDEPLLSFSLYTNPITATRMNKVANFLNGFNRATEYFVRDMIVDATVSGELRRQGIKLAKGATAKDVAPEMWMKGIDRALEVTFAKTPKSRIARGWMKVINNNPWFGVLTAPYPRFMANYMQTLFRVSPFGLFRLLTKEAKTSLASADARVAFEMAAEAVVGSLLFGTALYLNRNHAGEQWYQLKIGDKNIDTRTHGPLLPNYLFIADMMKQIGEDNIKTIKLGGVPVRVPRGMDIKDYVEGISGINRLTGTSLVVLSFFENITVENGIDKIEGILSDFLGGFATPAATLKDFIAVLSDEEAKLRQTREGFFAPFLSRIPFASRVLPERPSPFTDETQVAVAPGLKQLTGLSITPEGNKLEQEARRLNLSSAQIYPRTGDPTVDRMITSHMGEFSSLIAEKLGGNYDTLSDEKKELIVKEVLSTVRSAAREKAIEENASEIATVIFKDMEFRSQREKREILLKWQSTGLLKGAVAEELGFLLSQ